MTGQRDPVIPLFERFDNVAAVDHAAQRTASARQVVDDHAVGRCTGCGDDGCPGLAWAKRELGITDE